MRAKKALKNSIASLLYQAVAIICGLITPRLILVTFGSTYNGVISSATQFMSMISILTLGIAGATRVALYKTLAVSDTYGTSRIVKATERYMQKVGFCIIVYAVVLSIVYPLISHNDLPKKEVALLIGIVSLGTFAEYFFGTTYRTLLVADQREYVYSTMQIMVTILNTILTAALIVSGASIFGVKFASICVFAITPIFLNIYVKRNYNLQTKCEEDRNALSQRKAVAFHSVANIVHDNTDLIILTLFTDAKMISVYTVYNFVIGKIKSIMRSFTGGLEAAFGNMWVKKEMDNLQSKFRLYEYSMSMFVTIIFSCVMALILPFITLYTSGVEDINYYRPLFAFLVVLAEIVFCIRQPYLTLVQAAGKYEETKIGAAVEAIVNLVSSIILVNFIGINGVIVGTILANLIRTSQYAWFVSKRILNRSLAEIIKRVGWIFATTSFAVILALKVMRMISIDSWGKWIICGFISLLITSFFSLLMSLLFYRKDLLATKDIFMRSLKRRGANS